MSISNTKPVNDVAIGDTVLYPCQLMGAIYDLPRTVTHIVEYPANRVFYFADTDNRPGGFGIVARSSADLELVLA